MITLMDKCNDLLARAGVYPHHPEIQHVSKWLRWVLHNLPILVGYPGHLTCVLAASELAALLGLPGYDQDFLLSIPIRPDGLHVPRSSSSPACEDPNGSPPLDCQPLTSEGSYPDAV